MIKVSAAASVSLGDLPLVSYSVAGGEDENKNGSPDVAVSVSVLGRPVFSGRVDVPIQTAVAAVLGLFAAFSGKLPKAVQDVLPMP